MIVYVATNGQWLTRGGTPVGGSPDVTPQFPSPQLEPGWSLYPGEGA